jgi:hypothetical protein
VAAQRLYQELEPPQSSADRKHILDEWEDNLGIMFKHHAFDHELKIATGNPKNESILERFEQRYACLNEIAEFEDAFEMCAQLKTR